MLCIKLRGYKRSCGMTSGGIARIWIFDGEDFDFTQGAGVNLEAKPYTAITLRSDANPNQGALMFPIDFTKKSAEYSFVQSKSVYSVKYEHKLEFGLCNLSQLITNWNATIDRAGCCCGVGLVIQMNSGKVFIAGEKYVNGEKIDGPIKMVQNGSTGNSGKLLEDLNSETIMLTGNYNRKLYEYSGAVQSLIDLETPPIGAFSNDFSEDFDI